MNLKVYYSELSSKPIPSEKQIFRMAVMKACQCSKETFHRWMREPESIPHLAKEKIDQVIKDFGNE